MSLSVGRNGHVALHDVGGSVKGAKRTASKLLSPFNVQNAKALFSAAKHTLFGKPKALGASASPHTSSVSSKASFALQSSSSWTIPAYTPPSQPIDVSKSASSQQNEAKLDNLYARLDALKGDSKPTAPKQRDSQDLFARFEALKGAPSQPKNAGPIPKIDKSLQGSALQQAVYSHLQQRKDAAAHPEIKYKLDNIMSYLQSTTEKINRQDWLKTGNDHLTNDQATEKFFRAVAGSMNNYAEKGIGPSLLEKRIKEIGNNYLEMTWDSRLGSLKSFVSDGLRGENLQRNLDSRFADLRAFADNLEAPASMNFDGLQGKKLQAAVHEALAEQVKADPTSAKDAAQIERHLKLMSGFIDKYARIPADQEGKWPNREAFRDMVTEKLYQAVGKAISNGTGSDSGLSSAKEKIIDIGKHFRAYVEESNPDMQSMVR